jgi:hypothetical protein
VDFCTNQWFQMVSIMIFKISLINPIVHDMHDNFRVRMLCSVASCLSFSKRAYLVCDPAKIFLVSKFQLFIYSNPAHKINIGTANRWETTVIANHLDQS